eukprot:Nitzschia sp. Nitz4//scaffold227_size32659//8547//9739//NITZ4_007895-RA/size32659-augustus-gene-0.10-mRNA-1//-1//CDS//3329542785//1433//frame0
MVSQEDQTIFVKILSSPPSFQDSIDEAECQNLWKGLEATEQEETACTSYAYWYVSTQMGEAALPPQAKENAGLREIQRHWIAQGRSHDYTLKALRQALKYREQYSIKALRKIGLPKGDDDDDMLKHIHWIREELERQPMIVRGRASGSILIVKPTRRTPTNHSEDEAYLTTQFYTAERAMATAEFYDDHSDMWLLFSFAGYNSGNSISLTALTTMTTVLQALYPERLRKLVFLDAPFWMRALATIVRPLLSTTTAAKMELVTGEAAAQRALLEMFGEQPSPEILLNMCLSGDIYTNIDLEHYIQHVPLHRLYDDIPLEPKEATSN